MKKITLVLALMLLFISNADAQKRGGVSQNKWGFGPELDGGISVLYNIDESYSSIQLNINAGFFANYLISNNFSVELAAKYNYKFGTIKYAHYINVPALAIYHFRSGNHIGLGPQYSHCLNAPNISGSNYNYLSAVLEFSYMSNTMSSGNTFYFSKDKIFRHTLRIGYGITPIIGSGKKLNSAFIESVVKWDLLNKGKGRNKKR